MTTHHYLRQEQHGYSSGEVHAEHVTRRLETDGVYLDSTGLIWTTRHVSIDGAEFMRTTMSSGIGNTQITCAGDVRIGVLRLLGVFK